MIVQTQEKPLLEIRLTGIRRFDSRLKHTEGGCLEWTGGLGGGYGKFTFQYRTWRAHRFVWTVLNGEIPAGKDILHRCDNPPCCELAHLFLGDVLVNAQDREAKGRGAGRTYLGERNPGAKLTNEQAEQIRRRYIPRHPEHGTRAMAREFGICQPSVSFIVRGLSYATSEVAP